MRRCPVKALVRAAAFGAASLTAVCGARAADMPDFTSRFLGEPGVRWDGVVIGGSVGVSNLNSDFGNAASSLVAYALRNTTLESEFAPENWTALPRGTTNSKQFGFFLGYNADWESLVLGFDAAYNRPQSLQASASDSLDRIVTTSDSIKHDVTITASSSLKLIDYATVRARAGYKIGQFLPYVAVGAAVGRFDYTSSATVVDVWTDTNGNITTFAPGPQSDTKNGLFAAGGTVALGVDAIVLPNVFVRAEWEYTLFAPINGIRAQLNTGRVGAGLKF